MNKYEESMHHFYQLARLLNKLLTEHPEELKMFLRDIDKKKTESQQKQRTNILHKTDIKPSNKTKKLPAQAKSKIPIENAIDFLIKNFKDIGSVEEWSDAMGYSKSYFWRKFETQFHKAPQAVFIDIKKRALIEFFKNNRDYSCREAAKHIHLRDGNGLYQFVKRNFACTPTELMERICNEEEIL